MRYWLDGLVNSDLIHPEILSVVRVAGFLMGILISYAVIPKGPRRFAWVLLVFIGALVTKGLILLFEYLHFSPGKPCDPHRLRFLSRLLSYPSPYAWLPGW